MKLANLDMYNVEELNRNEVQEVQGGFLWIAFAAAVFALAAAVCALIDAFEK